MLRAAEPRASAPRELDADFLEFLGSIDSEGEGWTEFIENSPINKGDNDKGAKGGSPPVQSSPPLKSPSAPPAKTPPAAIPPKGK
jgi:hypothetical protein